MKKILTLLLLLLPVTSCTQTPSDSVPTGNEKVSITHSPTIDGVITETTEEFSVNPERVATFNYAVLDMFSTLGISKLGITHLGLPKSSLPASLSDFNASTYTNIGTLFEPDYTALDFFLPDLIILDGRTSALYTTLKARYPLANVLDASLSTFNVDIQAKVASNIQALFTKSGSDIDDILGSIQSKIAAIKEVAKDHEALFILSNGESLSAYGNVGRYNSIYNDFGFQPAVESLNEMGTHGLGINKEYLTEHDPEIIFLMDRAAAIGQVSGIENFVADPLVKTLRAYQNNNIYVLNAEAWYLITGGFQSTNVMINDVDQFTNLF